MENLCKHDKNKKNIKTLPAAINVGSGCLGIVGVVLVGGALVTATIVSALAFRSKSQRGSSSENTKKIMSQLKETQSFDAPNMLELVVNTDTEFSPREEDTSMEIQTNNSQSLSPDKKHDEQVHSRGSNEDTIDSVAAEDQENVSTRVDSAFEKDSCLERDDDGSKEQKHLMLTDNENEEHVDANSLVSDEGVVSIEEYEAVDVPNKDIVVKASKIDDEIEDGEDQVKVEENFHDEIIMEKCEGELSDEACYADQIVHELVMEAEEANDAAARLLRVQLLDGQDEIILDNCEGDLSNNKGPANQVLRECDRQIVCSSKQVMEDHEVATDAQEMQVNKYCETFVVACVMNRLKEAVDDEKAANDDTPPSRLINKEEKGTETVQKVEEHVTIEEGAAKVERITEHELVKKDEIPHVEYGKEDEDSEEDVTRKVELSSGVGSSSMHEKPTLEEKISNHKFEEMAVQVKGEIITDHELVMINEIPHVEFVKEDEDNEEDVTRKVEVSFGVSSFSMPEESTPEPKIINHKTEENMEENKTIISKSHNDNEEDVMVNLELSSCVSSPSIQAEPTLEAKISNHKIEDNLEENLNFLGKNHDDSEEDAMVKDELSSCVSSSFMQEEPTTETKISNHIIENMEENLKLLGKNHNDSEEVEMVAELSSGVDSSFVKEEPTPEAKISNHKIEENMEENLKLLGKNQDDNEEDAMVKAELSFGVSSSIMQEEPTPEAKIINHKTEENMEENQTTLGKMHNDRDDNGVIKQKAFASEPWNPKLMAWSALLSIWCLCHWYSELPFPELSLAGGLLFILILLGYRNRATHLVKYE